MMASSLSEYRVAYAYDCPPRLCHAPVKKVP
jgi:hypothetical protein